MIKIVHTIEEVRNTIREARTQAKSIGLVPTMGYFHEGHLSLMKKARDENDFVVVSIFVNPTQFGPNEDLTRYPRDLDRDSKMADGVGVDLIFNPSVEEMYPNGYATYVNVERLTETLCGASRPGHFRGVTTVVLKLLNIVQPDRAYFGMKDYQQYRVIDRMVTDLNVPTEIIPSPLIRETDGLAMSSRNIYLTPEERKAALILSRALHFAQDLLDQGIRSAPEIVRRAEEFIQTEPLAQIDYVALVDPDTLECIAEVEPQAVLALAVRIGKTRLIDNSVLRV